MDTVVLKPFRVAELLVRAGELVGPRVHVGSAEIELF
jgi:hypothetical protein